MATQLSKTTDLLDLALTGHGGLDRWRAIETITATLTVGGALFALKGHPDGFSGVQATADTSEPRLTFTPFREAAVGSFEPDRVAIKTADGVESARQEPRSAFFDLDAQAPWDDLHLLYFTGYALWNYLCTPFFFTWPGFDAEEVEPWQEGAESWRGLRVRFSPDVPTHCPEQVFYFDQGGLLRRLDYAPEVVSPRTEIPAAHYCYDHREISGLVVPTRRRVFGRQDDGTPAYDQTFVELDLEDVVLNA